MADNTQYNQIADVYSKLYPPDGHIPPEFPVAAVEAHQLYMAAHDPDIDIRDKRVLDLASGGGYYASKFLSWGAASVTGVDISSEMVEKARRDARDRGVPESKLRFMVGNATDETLTIDGHPFDIVTGCWLLNYAPDVCEMTKMWQFIGRHLKPGGYFIGLTIPPLLNDGPWVQNILDQALDVTGPWGRHGTAGKVLSTASGGDGYKTRVILSNTKQEEVVFDNYYLHLRVFEQSCADSKFFDGMEWRDFEIPAEAKSTIPIGYWNDLALYPHCRVVTAKKKA